MTMTACFRLGGELMEITQAKEAIARRLVVEFNGIRYVPVAYRLTLDTEKNRWRHSMELQDLKAKSITVAPLKLIKIIGGKNNEGI